MSIEPAPASDIDLSAYVDPDVEAIRIRAAAKGDPRLLQAYQEELRREESRGWCAILYMDDEIAVVRWHDQFVLTLTDPAAALIGEG